MTTYRGYLEGVRCVGAIWKGSRNYSPGRRGNRPQAVVIHTSRESLAGIDASFNETRSKVSAHYGVGRDGRVHQYVREADQAWHAGRTWMPSWLGYREGVNPNRYTIGIEHAADEAGTLPDVMYEASAALIEEICRRWAIPIDPEHVVGHRELFGRRACPEARFDLARLVRLAAGRADELDQSR
jgi:N-acetyl-anhydromuramyl-L-alanine amidase AmpD